MDNMEAKPSQIQQAGRGAFATRDIAKGKSRCGRATGPYPKPITLSHL